MYRPLYHELMRTRADERRATAARQARDHRGERDGSPRRRGSRRPGRRWAGATPPTPAPERTSTTRWSRGSGSGSGG